MFAPIDITWEAKSRGVTLDEYPFEHIRGCVCRADDRYHIGIASHLDPIKKRMCVAHELAHIEDDTIDSVHIFIAERRAYQIAREKLIPCEAIREALADWLTDYSTLASLFGVSEKMIQLRCRDLSIF